MATIDLSSVQAKVDRAAVHLKALDELIGPNVELAVALRAQHDRARDGYHLIFDGFRDLDLGVLTTTLGDFVHNARSALDHLISALVSSNSLKVRTYHEYPLYWGEKAFRSQVSERDPADGPSCLEGLRPDQVQIVANHQPYVGRNPHDARRAPLFLLHLAWNVDKHRRIHTSAISAAKLPLINLDPSPYFELANMVPMVGAGSLLNPKTEVAFIRVRIRQRPPLGAMPHVQSYLPVSVAFFGQGGIKFGMPEVRQMLDDTVAAIAGFDPSFRVRSSC